MMDSSLPAAPSCPRHPFRSVTLKQASEGKEQLVDFPKPNSTHSATNCALPEGLTNCLIVPAGRQAAQKARFELLVSCYTRAGRLAQEKLQRKKRERRAKQVLVGQPNEHCRSVLEGADSPFSSLPAFASRAGRREVEKESRKGMVQPTKSLNRVLSSEDDCLPASDPPRGLSIRAEAKSPESVPFWSSSPLTSSQQTLMKGEKRGGSSHRYGQRWIFFHQQRVRQPFSGIPHRLQN
ncbi:uncharacterized protein LOC132587386 [Heteronotia binoei]|uniref:uncharacterized protein LOC132587386 n=1 Tax=Heteronotia binoei TaxID=13085 RepID=UPI00292F7616|nr:uncharacterized protein LOC132587386 [Heteronotia binoei]